MFVYIVTYEEHWNGESIEKVFDSLEKAELFVPTLFSPNDDHIETCKYDLNYILTDVEYRAKIFSIWIHIVSVE